MPASIAIFRLPPCPTVMNPDEGEINYPWLYALLDKTGYDGWIGCEYIPEQTRFPGWGGSRPTGKKNKHRFLKK